MVMLVLLRLNIGWHFFSEGVKHYTDPNWSSEGFLRAATGPLAPKFRSVLPDYHGLRALQANGDADAADAWIKRVSDSLADAHKQAADFYKFSDEQKAAADKILALRQKQLADWLKEHKEEIGTYIHERARLAKARAEPTAEAVPFQKKRIADKQNELNRQASGWLAQIRSIETQFRTELADLRTEEQSKLGLVPHERTQLEKVDTVMTYGIMGIGICLLLGLFTRLACLLGAAFLFSVVLTQPFWVSDAQPTFNQWGEMIALLTLATTNVGKWGGLDFFVSCLFGGCCGKKGTCEK